MYTQIGKLWLVQNYVNDNGIIRNECRIYSPDRSLCLGIFLIPNNMPFTPDNPQLRNLVLFYGQMIGFYPVKPMKNSNTKN